MNQETQIINLQLLDKSWHIRSPADKTAELKKAASLLNNKMQEIAGNDKRSSERITVLGAISVIYDLLAEQNKKDLYIDSLTTHIRELQKKVNPSSSQNQEKLL